MNIKTSLQKNNYSSKATYPMYAKATWI